jgi:putative membrane protein
MDGILGTLLYLGSGLVILFIGFLVFTFTTKMSEQKLIMEDGNVAVALKLAGKLVGLAIVVMSAAKYSVNFGDFIVWSLIGVIAQMVTYWIAEFVLFPKVSFAKKVEEGNIAVASLLFTLSVTVGLLISGSISY